MLNITTILFLLSIVLLRRSVLINKFVILFTLTVLNFSSHAFDPTIKPINVIIPFSPGGSVSQAFIHLQKYAADRKITLVPVFKPGAEGQIGTKDLVKSSPDGYTISITLAAVLGLYEYQNQSLDLTVITGLRNNIMVMVSNPQKFPYPLSIIDSITRDNTTINYGYGSPSHKVIYDQYFKFVNAKSNQTLIPYKGGGKLINDLLSGQIDIGILPLTLVRSQIVTGSLKLVAIAVNTDYPGYKDVPRLGKIYSGWKNFDGVVVVSPKKLNTEAKLFWDKFLTDYLNDHQVQKDFMKDDTPAMKFGPQFVISSITNTVDSLKESK